MRIIAGPCQHESLDQSLEIADHCSKICQDRGIDYFFKASYDKANRTSLGGKRGLGLDKTLTDFLAIKKSLDIKILTDVHETIQIQYIEKNFIDSVDVYQIPAFLCRQTDLILEACSTDKIINIKKGQFLAPWDVAGMISKTSEAKELWITERGTSFGYNTLIVDFTGLDYLLNNFDNIVFDVTHSVQKPGGKGSSSGGNREYVPALARAASALGIENFFLEVHKDPDTAPSDGPNMVPLDRFESIIDEIMKYNYKR
jgi:2-dehydro-3-deoxyphosphooctonate aldolase (KDO 8-P synthase)